MAFGGVKPKTPAIQWGHPLARRLVIDMPLTEGGGRPVELVAKSKPAQIGTPTWSTKANGRVANFVGGSAFTVNNTHIPAMPIVNSMQIIFLVNNFAGLGADYISTLFGDDSNNLGNSVSWRLGAGGLAGNAQRLGVNFFDTTDHDDMNNTNLSTGVEYNVVITSDGANLRYYINGLLDTTNAYTFIPRTMQRAFHMGTDVDSHFNLDGYISLVRVWASRCLSAPEVKQLYQNPWQIYTTGRSLTRRLN